MCTQACMQTQTDADMHTNEDMFWCLHTSSLISCSNLHSAVWNWIIQQQGELRFYVFSHRHTHTYSVCSMTPYLHAVFKGKPRDFKSNDLTTRAAGWFSKACWSFREKKTKKTLCGYELTDWTHKNEHEPTWRNSLTVSSMRWL